MDNLLVTGASGFIGSRLCALLTEKNYKLEKFSGRLERPNTFNKSNFDVIIHLAATIPHKTAQEKRGNTWTEVNTEGTRNLLTFYKSSKFVFISTKDVAEPRPTEYASSKLKAEQLVARRAKNLIVRLPSIFGPGQKQDKLIPRLINHYLFNKPCELFNNDTREYMFVDDVCGEIISNLDKSGLIVLEGVKITNTRLKELIEAIHLGHSPVFKTRDEAKLFHDLSVCYTTAKNSKIPLGSSLT